MAKTKIKLRPPFSLYWSCGYLNINSKGRRTLALYNSPVDVASGKAPRSSTSYARYLMAVHIGRFLGENEHVDHINDDMTDDRIGNLAIESPWTNNIKRGNAVQRRKLNR